MRKEKLEELKKDIEELKTIEFSNSHKITGKFLSIEQVDCKLNNGKTIKRERIIKNGQDGNAVMILPITKEGNVILVIQPRVFSKMTVGVEIPAGYIEEGEEPMDAARRELQEETGYVSEEMIPLAKYYQDQGCSKAISYSYLAKGCERKFKQQLDPTEYVKFFECTTEELEELIEKGYILGAHALIAVEKAKKYNI